MNPFRKDIFREIKATRARFVSLAVITMLGAMSVVGIQATSIGMRDTADKMYKEHSLYDLQAKSTIGFGGADITAVRETAGVAEVMPTYIFDVYGELRGELNAVRTYAVPDTMNTVGVTSGRLPERDGEIAVERGFMREGRLSIGDSVTLSLDNMDSYHDVFNTDTFTITGVVTSPLYISYERGRTTLGAGTVRFYAYLHPDAYALDVYTDLYAVMDGSREMYNVSDEYSDAAVDWKLLLEVTGEKRAQAFKDELEDAQLKLDGAPEPEWFVFTRKDGASFESYYQDTLRLQKVGYVFPMVFFLVAILVSLTTMSRMVEEQRTQIGVYKALGYRPAAIMLKYAAYAFLSGLIGGVLGVAVGSVAFPLIITDAYGHLYFMPSVELSVPLGIAAFALVASIASVVAVTLLTCAGAMTGEPANLMRPKAPKIGKRVLLEKIPFVWNHLGFIGKVTARNIFRYKRRFLMTLVGVAGCTALLLTAFGLRDSIGGVARMQYTDIIKYGARAYTTALSSDSQREELNALTPETRLYIREESVEAKNENGGVSAALIVPEVWGNLGDFITLPEFNREGVVLTEKLARTLKLSAGSRVELVGSDNRTYTADVAAIAENYVMHFIYISPEYYAELFGKKPVMNSLLINGGFDTEELLKNSNIRGFVSTERMLSNLSDSTDALGIVTIVLLVLACALAFVVLFNLTVINITERMRELATIKVLGFQDTETAMYTYRENFAVTSMGIALGLIGGVFLNGFVLTSVEIDMLKFPHNITPASFVLSAALSLVFALFVNAATYKKLVDIDMVESLKNVE